MFQGVLIYAKGPFHYLMGPNSNKLPLNSSTHSTLFPLKVPTAVENKLSAYFPEEYSLRDRALLIRHE